MHIDRAMLALIVPGPWRPRAASDTGSFERSSLISAIAAASTAMSLPIASHGGANVGRFQGRRVVDPVADHADLTALRLQLRDALYFVCRQKSSSDFADASLHARDARPLFWWSPVSRTQSGRACPERRETTSAASGRSTSERATTPIRCSPSADQDGRLFPLLRSLSSADRVFCFPAIRSVFSEESLIAAEQPAAAHLCVDSLAGRPSGNAPAPVRGTFFCLGVRHDRSCPADVRSLASAEAGKRKQAPFR